MVLHFDSPFGTLLSILAHCIVLNYYVVATNANLNL